MPEGQSKDLYICRGSHIGDNRELLDTIPIVYVVRAPTVGLLESAGASHTDRRRE
jgi:hypothetical protein